MAINNSPESIRVSRQFKKTALVLALMTTCNWAYAQQEKIEKVNENDLEVIEVRGIRASMAENLAIKRLSNSIVDAITAEV